MASVHTVVPRPQVTDVATTVTTSLATPSLTALGVSGLAQGWVSTTASADRRRVAVQLQGDIPGRFYVTLRLLGRKVRCVSSDDSTGADAHSTRAVLPLGGSVTVLGLVGSFSRLWPALGKRDRCFDSCMTHSRHAECSGRATQHSWRAIVGAWMRGLCFNISRWRPNHLQMRSHPVCICVAALACTVACVGATGVAEDRCGPRTPALKLAACMQVRRGWSPLQRPRSRPISARSQGRRLVERSCAHLPPELSRPSRRLAALRGWQCRAHSRSPAPRSHAPQHNWPPTSSCPASLRRCPRPRRSLSRHAPAPLAHPAPLLDTPVTHTTPPGDFCTTHALRFVGSMVLCHRTSLHVTATSACMCAMHLPCKQM